MNNYIVLDLETTGFSPEYHSIVEIGAWKVVNGVAVDKFVQLCKPPMGIPFDVVRLTGITPEMVENCPDVSEVIGEFYDWCGNLPFLGFNRAFDYKFLCTAGNANGYDFTLNGLREGLCVMKAIRGYFNLEKYNLEYCLERFQVPVKLGSLHRADYDAYMTHMLYQRLLIEYDGVTEFKNSYELKEKDNRKYGDCSKGAVISFQ
jgi:DNA polymerase-3 subunit alpha (Gram-positive type)